MKQIGQKGASIQKFHGPHPSDPSDLSDVTEIKYNF